jgi:beta-mannosidase
VAADDRSARGGRRITRPPDEATTTASPPLRVAVEGHAVVDLRDGWQAAASEPGACADASELEQLSWSRALVPGTAADLLRTDGSQQWNLATPALDAQDWWFRRRLELSPPAEGEELALVFDGLATVAEVYLNGERILTSDSMFAVWEVDIGALVAAENELAICCRALAPLLAVGRRPRARWRTRLVADGGLRFFRTMLIGRAPGFAPGPAIVGPWRPVRLERRRALAVTALELRPRVVDGSGVLSVVAALRALGAPAPDRLVIELEGPGGTYRGELELNPAADPAFGSRGGLEGRGEVVVPEVALWWPHTHGEPNRYAVALVAPDGRGTPAVDCGQVGFRTLGGGERLELDGLQLRVNGEQVFVRGALWTPLEASGPSPSAATLRTMLESLRGAGMNMVRIPGTAAYESTVFHDLCDELGILVWQDFMFANLDYPAADPAFLESVRREVLQVLGELGGRPSLAVLCGSSEIAQQVSMLGLDPDLANGPLFGELLPELVRDAALDAVYVPSAPWGGSLPFRPDRGVANYYGVGGYRRTLEDARRSGVRFAAECLAFANVPDQATLDELAGPAGLAVHDPRWKAGVPRDVGSGWDFDDVRDHYLALLFGLDPGELRRSDAERYLELSRMVSGEVMSEVFGEWRRAASCCGGGLVLWLRDLRPGAGWGLLDHRGRPKVAYHHLRRLLAPLAVWSTDEGLSGIAVHVANDGPVRLHARLRVSLYSDQEVRVDEATRELDLQPHASCELGVEELLGRFVDVSWAYRFGPPAQDVVVCSLERPHAEGAELLSQSFRLPAGRPLLREPASRLGLAATLTAESDDAAALSVSTRRFAYGVRVDVPGFDPSDDAFSVEPGGQRRIELRRAAGDASAAGGVLTALNLAGRVAIGLGGAQ